MGSARCRPRSTARTPGRAARARARRSASSRASRRARLEPLVRRGGRRAPDDPALVDRAVRRRGGGAGYDGVDGDSEPALVAVYDGHFPHRRSRVAPRLARVRRSSRRARLGPVPARQLRPRADAAHDADRRARAHRVRDARRGRRRRRRAGARDAEPVASGFGQAVAGACRSTSRPRRSRAPCGRGDARRASSRASMAHHRPRAHELSLDMLPR